MVYIKIDHTFIIFQKLKKYKKQLNKIHMAKKLTIPNI